MKHRNTLTAAVALLAMTSAGHAADLNLPGSLKDPFTGAVISPNSWTGFYAGVNAGYGWDSGTNLDTLSADGQTVGAADGVGLSDKTSPSGWFGGVEVGYNTQVMGLITGIATDINISDINDNSNILVSVNGGPVTNVGSRQSVIDWFGSTRLVLGLPVGNLLPYGTVGIGYGGVRDAATIAAGEAAKLSSDDNRFGLVYGAGLAMKMSDRFNLKLEYMRYDFDNDSLSGLVEGIGTVSTNKVDNSFNIVRLGLVYHINP